MFIQTSGPLARRRLRLSLGLGLGLGRTARGDHRSTCQHRPPRHVHRRPRRCYSFICSSTALPITLSGLPIVSVISKWL